MVRLATATGRAIASSAGLARSSASTRAFSTSTVSALPISMAAKAATTRRAEGESLHGLAHLAGSYLEIVPDRHVRPILPQAGGDARRV